jgi:hypothetical protein
MKPNDRFGFKPTAASPPPANEESVLARTTLMMHPKKPNKPKITGSSSPKNRAFFV